MKAEQKSR